MEDLEKILIDYFTTKNKKNTISIDTAFNLFINFNSDIKRSDTIRFYRDHVKPFFRFCDMNNIKNFNDITNDILNLYFLYLKNFNNSNNTINKRIGLLRNIYHFLLSNGYINDLKLVFKHFEEKPKEITTITEKDILTLLEYFKTKSLKYRVIILLLLETGLRRNELVNIKKANINLKEKKIFLDLTKTHKYRYIYFSDTLKKLLEKQLKENTNIYLFETKDHKKLNANYITYILFMAKKHTKITNLSPHKLRHTYATMLLKNGANIEEVRRLLGHTSYEMTKRYLDFIEDDLKKANEKYNPLAKIYNEMEKK